MAGNSKQLSNKEKITWKMKLMTVPSEKQIVFAEVSSDFVDYWCSLLQKPFYEIIPKSNCAFADYTMAVKKLPDSMFLTNTKDFLSPLAEVNTQVNPQVRPGNTISITQRNRRNVSSVAGQYIVTQKELFPGSCSACGMSSDKVFQCPQYCNNICLQCKTCPRCGIKIQIEGLSWLKENLVFIISNSFEIFENSSIKAIELINKSKISNLAMLSSAEVTIDEDVMSHFILLMFQNSKTLLNDVLRSRVFT